MNRREFIEMIGLGGIATAAMPDQTISVFLYETCQYPELRFTGYKASAITEDFRAQLLWGIVHEDHDGAISMTHRYVGSTLFGEKIKSKSNQEIESYVETKAINSLLGVQHLIDRALETVHVEGTTEAFVDQVNPNYDPSHVCRFYEDDEIDENGEPKVGCGLDCPRHKIIHPQVMLKVRRANPISWKDMETCGPSQDKMRGMLDKRYPAADYGCRLRDMVISGMTAIRTTRR